MGQGDKGGETRFEKGCVELSGALILDSGDLPGLSGST
jgi:hypothetical protein